MPKYNKQIGERINWSEEGGKLYIRISGKLEKWKETVLVAWIMAWTLCGIYVLIQLFGEYSKDEKLAFVVYLFFWVYFEYKVWYALLWRLWGNEFIRIDPEQISIKRDIKGYGKVYHYYRENITELDREDYSGSKWLSEYSKSFWVVGGETLSFTHLGKKVGLGMQLEREDAKNLLRLIKSRLNKHPN